MDKSILYANAYMTDRVYGGPEEGGWYYDVGEPVMSLPFFVNEEVVKDADGNSRWTCDNASRDLAYQQVYDLCVAAGIDVPDRQYLEERDWRIDWFMIYMEEKPGEYFPKKRPHWDMGEDY